MTPTFASDEALYVVRDSPAGLQQHDRFIRTPSSQSVFDDTTRYTQQYLFAEFRGIGTEHRSANHLNVESGYDPIELQIEVEDNEVILNRNGETLGTVAEEKESSFQLEDESVEIAEFGKPVERSREGVEQTVTVQDQVGTKSISVTPEVTVANRGELPIYGGPGANVLPKPVPVDLSRVLKWAELSDEHRLKEVGNGLMYLIIPANNGGGA